MLFQLIIDCIQASIKDEYFNLFVGIKEDLS